MYYKTLKGLSLFVATSAVVGLSTACKNEDDAKIRLGKLVESIELNTTDETIGFKDGKSGTAQIRVTEILPADATDKSIEWIVEKGEECIALEDLGDSINVSAKQAGDAIITAKCLDEGGVSKSCTIHCVYVTKEVEKVIVSLPEGFKDTLPSDGQILRARLLSGALQLTATVEPVDATIKDVTWYSTNPEVAGVANGLVYLGGKKGEAYIYAKSNGINEIESNQVKILVPYTIHLNAGGGRFGATDDTTFYCMPGDPIRAPRPLRKWYSLEGLYDKNNNKITVGDLATAKSDLDLTARWLRTYIPGQFTVRTRWNGEYPGDGDGLLHNVNGTPDQPYYQRVYFSRGYLQATVTKANVNAARYYDPRKGFYDYSWKFAESQVKVIGNSSGNIRMCSPTNLRKDDVIDLFAFPTPKDETYRNYYGICYFVRADIQSEYNGNFHDWGKIFEEDSVNVDYAGQKWYTLNYRPGDFTVNNDAQGRDEGHDQPNWCTLLSMTAGNSTISTYNGVNEYRKGRAKWGRVKLTASGDTWYEGLLLFPDNGLKYNQSSETPRKTYSESEINSGRYPGDLETLEGQGVVFLACCGTRGVYATTTGSLSDNDWTVVYDANPDGLGGGNGDNVRSRWVNIWTNGGNAGANAEKSHAIATGMSNGVLQRWDTPASSGAEGDLRWGAYNKAVGCAVRLVINCDEVDGADQ